MGIKKPHKKNKVSIKLWHVQISWWNYSATDDDL